MMSSDPKQVVGRLVGSVVSGLRPLGGSAYEVHLEDDRRLMAKTDTRPGAIAAEVASFNWLAETGTVRLPKVRAHDDHWMVTDLVVTAGPSQAAAEALGAQLAQMHRAGAPAFGAPPKGGPTTGTIGLAPMDNIAHADWPAFYAAHRVEPYLKMASDRRSLSGGQRKVIEQVIGRIEQIAGPAEPPARLHGDLWSGNVLWGADGSAWLIDPAAHGGHRETDLAMLRLFGAPQLEVVLASYMDHYPLADGWNDRIGLHQLFPLLVHAALFGGGYAAQAEAAARSALRI